MRLHRSLKYLTFSGCSAFAAGFETDFYHSFIRFSIFGSSQLLASIGGFLSLIGGISVISLFEIFFFLGCQNLRRKRNLVSDATSSSEITNQQKNVLLQFLRKYCKVSSVHGLNNAAEGKIFGLLNIT